MVSKEDYYEYIIAAGLKRLAAEVEKARSSGGKASQQQWKSLAAAVEKPRSSGGKASQQRWKSLAAGVEKPRSSGGKASQQRWKSLAAAMEKARRENMSAAKMCRRQPENGWRNLFKGLKETFLNALLVPSFICGSIFGESFHVFYYIYESSNRTKL